MQRGSDSINVTLVRLIRSSNQNALGESTDDLIPDSAVGSRVDEKQSSIAAAT